MQPTFDPAYDDDFPITPGMVLPLPDEQAVHATWERLTSIDVGVNAPTATGLGVLTEPVCFIAGVQGTPYPRPLLSTRVVLVSGTHTGGITAGPVPDPRVGLPLQHLVGTSGAGMVILEFQPAASAIETNDAISSGEMAAALHDGWAEAERAADEGIEMLVLAAGGAGASTAAVAVIAALTGYEVHSLLGRVVTPAGLFDDNAWMTRCLALRDALHRVRQRDSDGMTVLAALGGADLAAATGLILGAAGRKLPIMIDGPIGAAAALLANDFAPQSRRWVLLPDVGRNIAVQVVSEALELKPWLDLALDLGEGVGALAALPMLQTALTVSGLGEPVDPTRRLSRFDASGNQVFVGVAHPVEVEVEPEPAPEVEPVAAPAPKPKAKSIGAKAAQGRAAKAATPKPPAKSAPSPRRSGGAGGGLAKATAKEGHAGRAAKATPPAVKESGGGTAAGKFPRSPKSPDPAGS